MNDKKMWVTCEVFTEKMNEALHQDQKHKDIGFAHNEDGLEDGWEDGLVLFAPLLSENDRMALHKAIFDEVSKHYSITRP